MITGGVLPVRLREEGFALGPPGTTQVGRHVDEWNTDHAICAA